MFNWGYISNSPIYRVVLEPGNLITIVHDSRVQTNEYKNGSLQQLLLMIW